MRDMTPEPTARAARSTLVRGTWPGYLGGGRFSAENCLLCGEVLQAPQVAVRTACRAPEANRALDSTTSMASLRGTV